MKLGARRPLRGFVAVAIAALALAVSACAPADDDDDASTPSADETSDGETAAADPCAVDQLNLITPGTLTVATDDPAYVPWFVDNDPTNGEGYESAVAYAVAKQMGFTEGQVNWVVEPFNRSYAPGAKDFDFDINQISILPKRAEAVDFSDGYLDLTQGVIVLKDSPFANATSLADLKDAKIGAQVGTTSLLASESAIEPTNEIAVFDDTNAAKQALLNGQIDAVVADLPTAFYISAVEIKGSTIIGQFEDTTGEGEQFGLLFEKGNPLVTCVNTALEALEADGTLADLEAEWVADATDVPVLG